MGAGEGIITQKIIDTVGAAHVWALEPGPLILKDLRKGRSTYQLSAKKASRSTCFRS